MILELTSILSIWTRVYKKKANKWKCGIKRIPRENFVPVSLTELFKLSNIPFFFNLKIHKNDSFGVTLVSVGFILLGKNVKEMFFFQILKYYKYILLWKQTLKNYKKFWNVVCEILMVWYIKLPTSAQNSKCLKYSVCPWKVNISDNNNTWLQKLLGGAMTIQTFYYHYYIDSKMSSLKYHSMYILRNSKFKKKIKIFRNSKFSKIQNFQKFKIFKNSKF